MANNNNCLFNAAIIGFCAGNSAWISDGTAADYAAFKNAAVAFATAIDIAIPADPLITTNEASTMLLDSASNTIQSDTQQRPWLLQNICASVMKGRYINTTAAASSSFWTTIATNIAALYNEMVLGIVSP